MFAQTVPTPDNFFDHEVANNAPDGNGPRAAPDALVAFTAVVKIATPFALAAVMSFSAASASTPRIGRQTRTQDVRAAYDDGDSSPSTVTDDFDEALRAFDLNLSSIGRRQLASEDPRLVAAARDAVAAVDARAEKPEEGKILRLARSLAKFTD